MREKEKEVGKREGKVEERKRKRRKREGGEKLGIVVHACNLSVMV